MLSFDISTPRHPNTFTTVDDVDAQQFVGVKWTPELTADGHRYAHRRPRGQKKLYLHRLIMDPAPGFVVDHIDRNGLNNTRANLRVVLQSQNAWNRGAAKLAVCSLKGVSSKRNGWRAEITLSGVTYPIGVYATQDEAGVAYDAAALALGMDRTGLNFPDRDTIAHLPDLRRATNQWGHPGVRQLPSGRFGVRIIRNGRRYSLGSFATASEACAAAIDEERAL